LLREFLRISLIIKKGNTMKHFKKNKPFFCLIILFTVLIITNNTNAQWNYDENDNIYFINGNVGIGTTAPVTTLNIRTLGWSTCLQIDNYYKAYKIVAANDGLLFKSYSGSPSVLFSFRNSADSRLFEIFPDGHVNIGSPPSGGSYKLNVGGNIRANAVVVNTSGADYVFADDYNLINLDDLSTYIKTNKHLPEIPSAEEMQKAGLSLGEMNTKILQKVEELTLYIIDQEKRIKALENKE
jgi:hypothetical protein